MKTGFMFPTGTYNIVLNKEELLNLLSRGIIIIHTSKTECSTGRSVWNREKEKMECLDRKDVPNNLRFHTEEPVADFEPGEHFVQYVNIVLDESCGFGRKENVAL